jgi:protein-S-isoprenylcysteine O-methyltransferase Ste14
MEGRLGVGASGELPSKSIIQRNRLAVRSFLLILMFGSLLFTDRRLDGTPVGMVLFALGSVSILTAAIVRFWCYVYNSGTRTKTIITQGPYSLCRNPIYLCSMLLAAGVGLLAQSVTLALLFGSIAFLFYLHIIEGEERKLTFLHDATYTSYRARTSKFIPHLDDLSPGVVESVPGQILMRKIPKLISLGMIFPIVEICSKLHDLLRLGVTSIY